MLSTGLPSAVGNRAVPSQEDLTVLVRSWRLSIDSGDPATGGGTHFLRVLFGESNQVLTENADDKHLLLHRGKRDRSF